MGTVPSQIQGRSRRSTDTSPDAVSSPGCLGTLGLLMMITRNTSPGQVQYQSPQVTPPFVCFSFPLEPVQGRLLANMRPLPHVGM